MWKKIDSWLDLRTTKPLINIILGGMICFIIAFSLVSLLIEEYMREWLFSTILILWLPIIINEAKELKKQK